MAGLSLTAARHSRWPIAVGRSFPRYAAARGWFRRRRKGASDEPLSENDFLVYVYQLNESASREQYAEFETWLVEYAGIVDWVFCGLAAGEDEGGCSGTSRSWTPRRTHAPSTSSWTGSLQEIDEDWVMDILSHTEGATFLTRIRRPEPIAAVKHPDGTVIPSPES